LLVYVPSDAKLVAGPDSSIWVIGVLHLNYSPFPPGNVSAVDVHHADFSCSCVYARGCVAHPVFDWQMLCPFC
jgi:hypothetical protein